MTMKKFLLIAILALLGAASCEITEPATPVGDCSFQISFTTGDLQTRADTPGDGTVADGGGIYLDTTDPEHPVPDIVILVANASSGAVVGTYPDPALDAGVDAILEAGAAATEMSFTFTGLAEGSYKVYAFANTGGYWSMSGQGGSTAKDYLLSLTTVSAIEALQFSSLFADAASSVCPATVDRLPLSASGTLTVSSLATGEISLEMIRCVSKVTAEFINNSFVNLQLDSFRDTLFHICPSTAYVLPIHSPDSPAGAIAGNILASETTLEIPAYADPPANTEPGSVTMSWYVFPSSGPYTCGISFSVSGKSYMYSNLPVHDDHAVSIPSLPRNKHLHVVTKISQGMTVSFNFEVSGWGEPFTEQILFN